MRRCSSSAIWHPRPKRCSLTAVTHGSSMLRSQRHVALSFDATAASSGDASATMLLITSSGRSVRLPREHLVAILTLQKDLIQFPMRIGQLYTLRSETPCYTDSDGRLPQFEIHATGCRACTCLAVPLKNKSFARMRSWDCWVYVGDDNVLLIQELAQLLPACCCLQNWQCRMLKVVRFKMPTQHRDMQLLCEMPLAFADDGQPYKSRISEGAPGRVQGTFILQQPVWHNGGTYRTLHICSLCRWAHT